MLAIDSILCVADASEGSRRAVHRAEMLATRHGAGLTRLTELRDGDALAQVHRAAQAASLVVVGSTRANPLRDFILGTPAERLVRTLKRPVLVVRRPVLSPYRTVLVPIDLDPGAEIAFGAAAQFAPGAVLHLLHAADLPWESKLRSSGVGEALIERQRRSTLQRGLRSLQALARTRPEARVDVAVAPGDPVRLTLARQRALDADLIVLGKSGRSTIAEFLMGSVAQRVLAEARSDVLVIPQATLARLAAANAARLQAKATPADAAWASAHWTAGGS